MDVGTEGKFELKTGIGETIVGYFEKASFVLLLLFTFLFQMAILTSVTEFAFYIPAVLLLVLAITGRYKIHFDSPIAIPLAIFVLWSFTSIFFALNKLYSLNDFLRHLLKHILLYLMVFNLIDTKRKLELFSWVFIFSAFCFSMSTLGYEYLFLGNDLTQRFGLQLIRTPTNLIGIVTIFAMLLSIRLYFDTPNRNKRILLIGMFIPILLITIFTQTRSNYVALFISIPILFYRKFYLTLIIYTALLIVILLSPVKDRIRIDGSIHHRISLFYISKEIIKDHPIIGIGFGINTMADHSLVPPKVYNQRVPKEYRLRGAFFNWPHNMFLDIAVRLGLVGLVVFCALFASCCIALIKLARRGQNDFIRNWSLCILSALMMFMVKGNFEPVFSTIPEVVLFLILSLTAVLWRMNRLLVNPVECAAPKEL